MVTIARQLRDRHILCEDVPTKEGGNGGVEGISRLKQRSFQEEASTLGDTRIQGCPRTGGHDTRNTLTVME